MRTIDKTQQHISDISMRYIYAYARIMHECKGDESLMHLLDEMEQAIEHCSDVVESALICLGGCIEYREDE